jgi:hypothetical protein
VARELTLSFVPDAEQRLWRTVTRRKYQLTRDHVRLLKMALEQLQFLEHWLREKPTRRLWLLWPSASHNCSGVARKFCPA